MASFAQKLFRILNPFDEHTVRSSSNAPGGILDQRRAGPLDPLGAIDNYQNIGDLLLNQGGGDRGLFTPTYASGVQDKQSGGNKQSSSTGGTTGGAAGDGDTIPLPTWIFEGNVFQNFMDYINAMGESIDRDLNTDVGRAREDSGRTRSRFLDTLGTQEKKGQADLSSYYSNLGDIYQSSEGQRRTGLEQEVGAQRTSGLGDIDRALNDYIQGRTSAAQEQRGGLFSSVGEMRDQIARNPGAQFNQVDPTGSIKTTDTQGLLAQLNQYMNPDNVRRRYTSGGSVNPINSYLNPTG